MKRYRVLSFDFDARVHLLTQIIQDAWEEAVKALHRQNKQQVENDLVLSYGLYDRQAKLQNFIDLADKPMSVVAFHNRFFEQIRIAFVMGAFYPALTAACALGERILNYLILVLRDDYKSTPEYKAVYRKDSFDNWDVPIGILETWGVLLPSVVTEFRRLKERRNSSIHFRPDVDRNDRDLALSAVLCLRDIIRGQFGAFGTQPWFITNIPGEIYIRREWETQPFIRRIYLPNCLLVGPKHQIVTVVPMVVNDEFEYENRVITDDEFADLRKGKG
jgi:hypothetical protein